jgi:hypothetical protein
LIYWALCDKLLVYHEIIKSSLYITEYIETRGIDIIKDLKLAALNFGIDCKSICISLQD